MGANTNSFIGSYSVSTMFMCLLLCGRECSNVTNSNSVLQYLRYTSVETRALETAANHSLTPRSPDNTYPPPPLLDVPHPASSSGQVDRD
eukprot:822254-Rhodomonas_salina.1